MAGVPRSPNTELLCKFVQDLAISGKEPPKEYICKDTDSELNSISSSVPRIEIPVIDLALLQSPSSSPAGKEELQKLRSALSSWGCFQVINHGVASGFLDKLLEVAKQFFALPMEEKHKCSRAADDIEGYWTGTVFSEQKTLDWTDTLYLRLTPEEQQKLKYWPQKPNDFRETLQNYTFNLQAMTEVILKAMALSLNVAENSFLKQYGESGIMKAKFSYYPPCPRPDLILGLRAHADGTAITILLQDKQVEGLQVFKDGEWVGIAIVPHALLVNVGDQMQIMSNDIFKSPMHRVVTNTEKERISLAVFCLPESGKEIEPVEELCNEESPKLYKSVTNYADSYFQYVQRGIKPIDAVKI